MLQSLSLDERQVKAKGGLVASCGSTAAVDGEVISHVSGKLSKHKWKKQGEQWMTFGDSLWYKSSMMKNESIYWYVLQTI